MTDAGLMGKASIDWDHLDADDHENLEKLTAPYWAIDKARGKGQGEIGRPRVLEAFFVITLRRPGESLCLSQEAIDKLSREIVPDDPLRCCAAQPGDYPSCRACRAFPCGIAHALQFREQQIPTSRTDRRERNGQH
jgi:hypothetical protein